MIIVAILLILLSYFYGCFSTARILAKSVRSLNIYKVGSGFADTENIYSNISKPLGVLAGAVDTIKSFAYLYFIRLILSVLDGMSVPPDLRPLYSTNMLLLYGLAMLIGHCLPLTNKLRGGRGIFTYLGMMAFFTMNPTLATAFIALLLVFFFKQVRFAQYTIVILPVLLTQVCSSFKICSIVYTPFALSSLFTTKLLGMAIIMGILNFIVSKKLGEF
ncbi:MAG: glycerol-3-phosphate acyltransferase [Candidatus Cloacimonetes bacterium]|nr:glycerol-3-phosphate acyltransferase [Candidatus Cloacimonadota bacterium]